MNYHFTDSLTAGQAKSHIAHPFDVPEGSGRVRIHLSFTPARVEDLGNMLTLTLFDADGFRGAGHRGGAIHSVEIALDRATPGYTPGPLPPGRWSAQIDAHRIMPGQPCHYTLDVTVEPTTPDQTVVSTLPPLVQRPSTGGPGWYRGDLHGHTLHSDGGWTPAEFAAAARHFGLDFVTLTDHNTTSGLDEMARQAGADLLVLGGLELTTFWGHAICLGTREWIDWRVDRESDDMAAIARQVNAAGQLFIIAHPKDEGDPYCTGCRWLYERVMPGPARFVEIWNEDWDRAGSRGRAKNEGGLALYYEWLNAGLRLVATAGSDTHRLKGYEVEPGFNVVYAEELSERGILAAIRAGHLYLSSGPELILTARMGQGIPAMMGDSLAVAATGEMAISAAWRRVSAGATLRLIRDGLPLLQEPVSGEGEQTWTLEMADALWFLLELRGPADDLLAITNPVFIGLS